jgi:hypothetical protein
VGIVLQIGTPVSQGAVDGEGDCGYINFALQSTLHLVVGVVFVTC